MNLAMNKERIHNFVLDLCRQNKVECEWHFSENTNSMYYKIYKDDVWLTFRISDHAKKQRSLPSITVSRSTTLQHVGKFVHRLPEGVIVVSSVFRIHAHPGRRDIAGG